MGVAERSVGTGRKLRPGQVAVEVLEANGVDVVFGLNGEHVLGLYDALAGAPSIRHVTVKHENNAAIAAEAYGRLTGRPGVVTVTAGPGATNSLSGVAGAYATGSPVVHISGGVPLGADLESFHGVDDPDVLEKAFAPATKWSVRVTDPGAVAAALTRAFALAVAGRPGPVHVELARSVLDGGPIAAPEIRPAPVPPAAPAANLDRLIARIDAARQIAIVAGKGAWWPAVSAELPRLAEALGAPVAHTWDGHAAMPTGHPLHLGMYRGEWSHPEVRAYLRQSDLVLGVGVRPGTEAARVLPGECGGPFVCLMAADGPPAGADLAIPSMASLAATLRALTEGARRRHASDAALAACARSNRTLQAALAAELQRVAAVRPWHIGLAIQALAERMTPDHVVVSDVSNVKLWMPLQLPVFAPESHVQAGTWGAMGYALPAALGAAFARPGRKVISLAGDASFLMASSDFVTLCQWGLPVVMVVHHDGQIGMINNMQTRNGGPTYATNIGDVDYARYAEAHGATGIRVQDPADLGAAWDRALAADGPVLLELAAGHDFPWPRIPRLLAEE
ncbi:MAG TPA: thiamine pyrophosphate-binding protein [Chloroflexota bacterium]|nr:thiamine pyrophosphate-binding protein [Chloroflexota bacterium]